jgi:hypothetical protein
LESGRNRALQRTKTRGIIVSSFCRLRDEPRLLPEHDARLAEAEQRLTKLML